MEKDLDFGDYVKIEQKRYGVPNEMYLYKVIGRLKSNAYVDVPVQVPATQTIHDDIVPVLACICCGVNEVDVRWFRLEDVNPYYLEKRTYEEMENDSLREQLDRTQKLLEEATAENARLKYDQNQ